MPPLITTASLCFPAFKNTLPTFTLSCSHHLYILPTCTPPPLYAPLYIPYVFLKYGLALPKAKPDIVPNVAKNNQNNQGFTIERLALHMSPGQS